MRHKLEKFNYAMNDRFGYGGSETLTIATAPIDQRHRSSLRQSGRQVPKKLDLVSVASLDICIPQLNASWDQVKFRKPSRDRSMSSGQITHQEGLLIIKVSKNTDRTK